MKRELQQMWTTFVKLLVESSKVTIRELLKRISQLVTEHRTVLESVADPVQLAFVLGIDPERFFL
jgi:hypothetical protein